MDREIYEVKPNPRLVALLDFAITEVEARLYPKDEYREWLAWASSWKAGKRSPQGCVHVAHQCFEHRGNDIWHCLGQLAWAAKEACYDTPKSGWLVVRYIADAMCAFGVAFSTKALDLLDAPVIDLEAGKATILVDHQ